MVDEPEAPWQTLTGTVPAKVHELVVLLAKYEGVKRSDIVREAVVGLLKARFGSEEEQARFLEEQKARVQAAGGVDEKLKAAEMQRRAAVLEARLHRVQKEIRELLEAIGPSFVFATLRRKLDGLAHLCTIEPSLLNNENSDQE